MADEQCPNCGQFKFSEKSNLIPGCWGGILIVAAFVLPFLIAGGAGYHGGGVDFEGYIIIGALLIITGIILILYSIFRRKPTTKTFDYACSNCKYTETFELK